jgi:hyperosmotically inducible periplasmic protein
MERGWNILKVSRARWHSDCNQFARRLKGMNLVDFVKIGMAVSLAALVGCSSANKAPDVSNEIRKALDQAGLKDVSESQDRDKAVITLGGHVPANSDKDQAERIAKSLAGSQVVSDQIAVLPPGYESDAKKVNSDVDKGIENNLDAALIKEGRPGNVKYSVKNGVVVLTGDVNSQSKRTEVERIAAAVPYVQQVVNELQVQDQTATSSR